jgi:hypothetical protein
MTAEHQSPSPRIKHALESYPHGSNISLNQHTLEPTSTEANTSHQLCQRGQSCIVSNRAAGHTAAKARLFKADVAPMPTPEAHKVVIRNYAVAINPVDYAMQDFDRLIKTYRTSWAPTRTGRSLQSVLPSRTSRSVTACVPPSTALKPEGLKTAHSNILRDDHEARRQAAEQHQLYAGRRPGAGHLDCSDWTLRKGEHGPAAPTGTRQADGQSLACLGRLLQCWQLRHPACKGCTFRK